MVRPEHRRGELPQTRDAYRELTRIALPSVIEMVLMALIGSIDTIMIGGLDQNAAAAVAAVGLTGQPRMLMLSIFFALNIGVTAVVARRKGQGLREDANRSLRSALVLIVGLSLALAAIALPLAPFLLRLAGANESTLDMAVTYFSILAWFLPINALTMCINAAQRGVGNTRITLYTNVASNVVNVFMNWVLIYGHLGFPRLGVAGAAYATGIGFAVGGGMALFSLMGRHAEGSFLYLSLRDDWRVRRDAVTPVMKVGGNAMLEQVALRIGFFTYAAIIGHMGKVPYAAHTIAMQFLNISFSFGDGIGIAATSLVGQMMGRQRPDLSVVYGKCAQRMALVVSLALAIGIAIFRHPLSSMFLSGEDADKAAVLALAANVMFMVALFQPFQTSSVVISGCLRGAGDNLYVAAVMMICVTGIRPLLSALAVYGLHLNLVAAWGASLIDMAVRLTLVYIRFSGGKWHDIKV
ncbi:MAG: MATE family efflux transporter [Clostridiales bacterium]|nr:MATE family efflux transporter [Clostridiales bacterium]